MFVPQKSLSDHFYVIIVISLIHLNLFIEKKKKKFGCSPIEGYTNA